MRTTGTLRKLFKKRINALWKLVINKTRRVKDRKLLIGSVIIHRDLVMKPRVRNIEIEISQLIFIWEVKTLIHDVLMIKLFLQIYIKSLFKVTTFQL